MVVQNNLTHRAFEAIQYYLLKASNELAKEQGHAHGLMKPPMQKVSYLLILIKNH